MWHLPMCPHVPDPVCSQTCSPAATPPPSGSGSDCCSYWTVLPCLITSLSLSFHCKTVNTQNTNVTDCLLLVLVSTGHECVDTVAMLVVVPDYTNTVTPDTGHCGHQAPCDTWSQTDTRGQCQYLGHFGEIFIGLLFVSLECHFKCLNKSAQLWQTIENVTLSL